MADINISKLKLPNDNNTYHYKDTVSGYKSTDATQSEHGLLSTTDKIKLDGIATGAEVNQNAFSNIKVGSTTVAADSKTDTLELVAGANITLTPDATNDKITISLDDTVDTGEVIATDIQAGNLIVNGSARFLNTIYGDISGGAATATSATKATQDESGNNIKSTYAASFSISDHTITLKNKNGTSLGTVTVPDNNTTYTVATGTANGKIKVTPSTGNAYEVSVYGLKSAAYKDVTNTYSETGTDPVSGKAVKAAIDGLPSPMVFRGTVGAAAQSPTVTSLPVDGTAVVGDTYKVITNGTYGGKASKVGDTLICLTKTSSANTWEIVPSGDEPSGTVTSVGISNGGGLTISGSPITSSGTITITHNNSGVTAGTYKSVTVNAMGHVTAGTNPTTLSGYGITDAKIANGTITLGSNSITPLTQHQDISGKLDKSGGTMTGLLKAQANVYTDSYTGALDMQNSNIYGVNSIITADLADNAGEGIHFYRDSTHVDTLWVAGGDIMFVPNRALGTSTTAANSQKVGRFTVNPTSGQVVITDGTTGGMKSSGYTIATSVPSGAKFTDTTYSAGDNMTLSSTTFSATKRWNAVTQGLKWSRIALVENTVGVEGNSSLLHVACTRGNTVCNATFLINVSHSSYGQIIELGSNNYSKFKVRLVVNSNGYYYIEIYDTASSIASGTTQTWHCSLLTFQPATVTTYTAFTDGTTVPSGYTAIGEMETVVGDNTLAIRNITRSGTTFTATRQNGSTFTFNQQDNNTTYTLSADTTNNKITLTPSSGSVQSITVPYATSAGSASSVAWSNVTSKPTTLSGYGITDAKIASGVITLGSNTITPLTAASTLDATKLSGTIPSGCYTDTKNTAGSTDTSSKIFLIGATSQTSSSQTYSQDTAYVDTDGCVYSGGNKVEVVSNNAGYHNSIYRGKDLGTSITEAQWASISAGTFEDMYIGDYWTLSTTLGSTTSNVKYVIAGFDYWWNCGDSYPQSSNKHHVVLVPASYLYTAQMNETNITTGGYLGSLMYTTNLANARTGISNLFGDHLYSVRRLFTNAVNSSGQAISWAWTTSSVDLMNENMVYGSSVWTTSGFEVGVDRTILPLFALNPASASIRASWWLRSVAAPAYFSLVYGSGCADCDGASGSRGVRPAFAIY